MSVVPLLPETAPFSPEQRAWLNGFFAGLFIVPIAAVLQHRPAPEDKGAVQGAANVLSFVGILGASAVQWVALQGLACTPGQVFWFCGIAALATGAYSAITRGRFIVAE